ncbi:MAG: DUF4861 domain-containing protein [Prevotella sp.]|jgi:hypothetical protein|nr:DUF4861 domain-containing protein [Prevotella sp.]
METGKHLVLAAVILLVLSAESAAAQRKVEIINKSATDIVDYTAELPVGKLKLPINNYIAVCENGDKLPVEITSDVRGNTTLIFPASEIKANSTLRFSIQPGEAPAYPKRTYAELSHKIGGEFVPNKDKLQYKGEYAWVKPNYLRVPDGFTDHAYYIKYEGPGWESDKVAFRFYLDWRNGIDVFAKKTKGIVLPFVGVDGYENYHKMAVWGMDNQTVGDGLGLGSVAVWNGEKAIRVAQKDSTVCYVKADGKVRSQVMTTYYGWDANGVKCNLQSLISIDAGSRASHIELLADKRLENIATGIIKDKNAELIKAAPDGEWACIATFGKQSLNGDNAGLAVFYRKNQLKEITEDKLNHVLVLKPEKGYADYYFMATWELDWEHIATKADFQRCINEVLSRLNGRILIKIE